MAAAPRSGKRGWTRYATTFPFAAESHVLCMLITAHGDAEVVAECLSEYSTSPRNGNRHF